MPRVTGARDLPRSPCRARRTPHARCYSPSASRRRERRMTCSDRPGRSGDGCRQRHRPRDRRASSPPRARASPASTARGGRRGLVASLPERAAGEPLFVEVDVAIRGGGRGGDATGRRGRPGGSTSSSTRAGVREIGDVYSMPARGVGERDRDQPQRHVLLLPGRRPVDARDGRRVDRQPLVGRRADGPLAPAGLLRREARDRRPDEEPRARPRSRRHPRQRALPRRHPHAADRAVLRRRRLRAGARRDAFLSAATARRATWPRRRSTSRATWRRT